MGQIGFESKMCRATAGPLIAMVGVAGTFAGVALAVVRERVDRISDARAAKMAAEDQESLNAPSDESDTESSKRNEN